MSKSSAKPIETLAVNTIRTLSMDAVQRAVSGHPGTPMALAPVAYVVFNEFLRYDPAAPAWPGRDRFVLSCGHASMLLYSMLHLTGVRQIDPEGKPTEEPAVSLESIRQFRQLDSRTPGHPEYGHTSGVETTTGPLGQGVGNSLGMAVASRWLSARFDRPGFELFGHDVYALCSDGDLMEGVAAEAASLAGHLKLSNLCWIYDDNEITIEGNTSLSYSEEVPRRFRGYGWHVVEVDDANDLDAVRGALHEFHHIHDRPTLIVARSHIAWGAPNVQGSHEAHGAPLGEEEIRLTKQAYNWPETEHFLVPDEVPKHFQAGIGKRGRNLRDDWCEKFKAYRKKFPELADAVERIGSGRLPDDWDSEIQSFPADAKGMASRVSSGKVLNQVATRVPWLLGGSADLAPSNKTLLNAEDDSSFSAENPSGRNFHFGIREHAMGAMVNGMALSGLRPYAGTFFVFSDYMRPAIRLAALMRLPVIYIFTHDSIGVGEDGPTHQPVEHLAALRAIPNLVVLRPGDANEVAESYRIVMQLKASPAALILTRQNLPTYDRDVFAPASDTAYGGYIFSDPKNGPPELILLASGSELSTAVEASRRLTDSGIKVRVVSMPSWELFDAQPETYRDQVLPPDITARVAVEAGIRQGWDRYLGPHGRFVGMDGFGASAPAAELFARFGITPENVANQARAVFDRKPTS